MGGLFNNIKNNVNIEQSFKESLIKPISYCHTEEKYRTFSGLVQDNIKLFYQENRFNPVNISICLDKKDFNSKIQSKRIVINHKKKYVNWKDYFIDFLYHTSNKGYDWSHELVMYANKLF